MNLADDRDERVMVQAARGRPQLLEILVRRHASALLTFIHRMVGDRHRSEELFQDVFLSVWINRARYEFPRPLRKRVRDSMKELSTRARGPGAGAVPGR
jgi:DNA-directed RNA polymerase specialized sigma24 family protein